MPITPVNEIVTTQLVQDATHSDMQLGVITYIFYKMMTVCLQIVSRKEAKVNSLTVIFKKFIHIPSFVFSCGEIQMP